MSENDTSLRIVICIMRCQSTSILTLILPFPCPIPIPTVSNLLDNFWEAFVHYQLLITKDFLISQIVSSI